jgi:glycosyltransferase involved in cell wall biosynthesis
LRDQGHIVSVVSGPPYPELESDIPVFKLPSLDLFNADDLFRMPSFSELKDPVNLFEWLSVSTQGFPEPFTFGIRASRFLKKMHQNFDLVHDNQCLAYGLLSIKKLLPTIATIHHPITRDRKIKVDSVDNPLKKLKHMRWYSFLGMQKRVARRLSHIVTVSECAKNDIAHDFRVPRSKFRVVPNGIDTDLFYPVPEIEREKNRIIVTNSADTPLKGLSYLLRAVHNISKSREIKLTVIGAPQKNGYIEKLVRELGIGDLVTFTGRVSYEDFVKHYARASVAVVPSIYEGFGLPAGEAMACRVPVVSTTGGALKEVVGDAGVLVPPADTEALVKEITVILDNPERASELADAGYARVFKHFTWNKAAEKTVEAYREAMRGYQRQPARLGWQSSAPETQEA